MNISLATKLAPQPGASGTDSSAAADNKKKAQSMSIRKAAQEFESQLLESIWKTMGGTVNSDEAEQSSDPAAGNIKDLQIQALCSGMAKGGGIGIAKMIVKHLESQSSTKPDSGSLQNHQLTAPAKLPADSSR